MKTRYITAAVAGLLAFCAPGARAQSRDLTPSDDPFAPRSGAAYLSSDFMHGIAKVFAIDPSSERLQKAHLPMGDARFAVAPSILLSQHIALDAEAGVFARFLLDKSHLVSTDWFVLALASYDVTLPHALTDHVCNVGLACTLRVSGGLRHTSAHGGDEIMYHENLPFRIYSRDGYVARAVVETPHAGGRFEINDDVRTYGLYPETTRMAELWVRPLLHLGARIGALRRRIPGSTDAYRALYAALPFRAGSQAFELRARVVRGAIPIGYVHGASEHAVEFEFDIK